MAKLDNPIPPLGEWAPPLEPALEPEEESARQDSPEIVPEIVPEIIVETQTQPVSIPFAYPRLKLGAIRRQYGVSIKTILREIGISEQTYSLIERGANNPKFTTLCQLCRLFQLSLDDLFGDLAEQLAPGYGEAVERGRAGEPMVFVNPSPRKPKPPKPSDDYNLVPTKPLLKPRMLTKPASSIPSDLLPPPPPEFLKAMVEEFDKTVQEFFDPFAPDPPNPPNPKENS